MRRSLIFAFCVVAAAPFVFGSTALAANVPIAIFCDAASTTFITVANPPPTVAVGDTVTFTAFIPCAAPAIPALVAVGDGIVFAAGGMGYPASITAAGVPTPMSIPLAIGSHPYTATTGAGTVVVAGMVVVGKTSTNAGASGSTSSTGTFTCSNPTNWSISAVVPAGTTGNALLSMVNGLLNDPNHVVNGGFAAAQCTSSFSGSSIHIICPGNQAVQIDFDGGGFQPLLGATVNGLTFTAVPVIPVLSQEGTVVLLLLLGSVAAFFLLRRGWRARPASS